MFRTAKERRTGDWSRDVLIHGPQRVFLDMLHPPWVAQAWALSTMVVLKTHRLVGCCRLLDGVNSEPESHASQKVMCSCKIPIVEDNIFKKGELFGFSFGSFSL